MERDILLVVDFKWQQAKLTVTKKTLITRRFLESHFSNNPVENLKSPDKGKPGGQQSPPGLTELLQGSWKWLVIRQMFTP